MVIGRVRRALVGTASVALAAATLFVAAPVAQAVTSSYEADLLSFANSARSSAGLERRRAVVLRVRKKRSMRAMEPVRPMAP